MRNRLILVVILVSAVSFPSFANAGLLSVTNNNSNDASDVYVLRHSALADGELVNIDRTHVFADLPAMMVGHDFIMTANDDKTAYPGFSIDVTFEPGTTLLLSIDGRVGDDIDGNPTLGYGVMDWVINDGWVDTGMTWYKANEPSSTFQVYSLTPAGTSYTFLEQYDGVNRNMYSISAAPVPLPSTMFLLGTGLSGLALIGRWRSRVGLT